MLSIVGGLKPEFVNEIAFLYEDVEDGAVGQEAFKQLSLPGHPTVIIFRPDSSEAFRRFGVVLAPVLRGALNAARS
jgi:hypothetical protein